jgi:outer membrane protein
VSARGVQGLRRLACMLAVLFCAASPALPQQAQGLTLDEARRLAQASSDAIRIRELAVQRSRLAMDEAAGKAWPHVDFQVAGSYLLNPPTGYTVTKGQLAGPPTAPFQIPDRDFNIAAQLHNYFSFAATVSQPLFTWGKIRNAIDAAALQVDSAGTDLVMQRRDIEREVRRAYSSALLAQESAKVLRRIADSAAQVVADRQSALDQGSLTREAVLEASSRRAELDARLAEAVQGNATALESLGILTGLDPAAIELATPFEGSARPVDESTLRARALDASTDVAASQTRQSLAQKKLAIERGGSVLRPDVSLGVSFAVTGQEDIPYSAWQWNNTTWSWDLIVSLGVKMSVFDGGESAARIGQAEKDAEAAEAAVQQARKLTRLAVRKAVDAAVKAGAILAEREAQEQYVAERLKNAQASVQNGMSSREDLHGAEILLGSAQLDRLLAQYTCEEAAADIAHLTGETP